MGYQNSKKNIIIFDIVIFIVRIFIGFAMLSHGFPKLQTLINGGGDDFFDFLGLGSKVTLGMTVFAEFVCSIFLILGLFTRIAAVFLISAMTVIGFVVHSADGFDKRETSLLYLSVYLIIVTLGAGRFSVDYMIEKRKRASDW